LTFFKLSAVSKVHSVEEADTYSANATLGGFAAPALGVHACPKAEVPNTILQVGRCDRKKLQRRMKIYEGGSPTRQQDQAAMPAKPVSGATLPKHLVLPVTIKIALTYLFAGIIMDGSYYCDCSIQDKRSAATLHGSPRSLRRL
jgi:hypothetical protein